jgi:hypothetical protein
MIHRDPREAHTRRKNHDGGGVRQTFTYLLGTVGVAIILAVAITLADRYGWLEEIQIALRHIKLPGLPSAPQAGLSGALPELGNNVQNVGQSTTTLWQRGSEHTGQPQQPRAADRRD